METWEKLLVGALALLVLFWFFPGIRPMLERSREAPKDWAGVLVPVAVVVLFVLLLINMV